jgi:transposase-like protein
MSNTRRKFSPEFKFKVVLEALKERETLAQLAVRFEVHQTMISNWKKEFVKNPEKFFEKDHSGKSTENMDANSLYAKIGQLEMENDFLKKSLRKIGL